jgi:RNA polymerase sigma-70 factor (ECF subfamily)
MSTVAVQRTDEELMVAYCAGSDAAFRELFQRFAPVLLRLLRRNVGRPADAQELTQQTFLQLHRARHDFRAGTMLRPWIMTIALNLARDLLRRRGRRPEVMVEESALPASVAIQPITPKDNADSDRVRAALQTLPKQQREVIELHWYEELSFNEIAAIIGATSGAARVRAHRGYATLRKVLEEGRDQAQL